MSEEVIKYSEERRNDPQIRELVKTMIDAQTEAVAEAEKLLQHAWTILYTAGSGLQDQFELKIYRDALEAVSFARQRLQRGKQFSGDSSNETYVGNLAASPVGELLKRRHEAK